MLKYKYKPGDIVYVYSRFHVILGMETCKCGCGDIIYIVPRYSLFLYHIVESKILERDIKWKL